MAGASIGGWTRRIVVALLAVAVAGVGVVYAASQRIIIRPHDIAAVAVPVPHDAGSIAEGARLATLVGCPSCHGNGKGAVWTPVDWTVGQIAPPAIARKIAGYSDAELTRLIRHGVKKDGSTLFVMASWSERYLADDDLGRVIAWARSLKPAPDDSLAESWWGPKTRWQMLTGAFRQSVQTGVVAAKARPVDVGPYFVKVLCSECHDLHAARSNEGQAVPPLAEVGAAYGDADFLALLRTGKGLSRPDLGLMTTIAKENLHALSDDEVMAIHRYLQREAARSSVN